VGRPERVRRSRRHIKAEDSITPPMKPWVTRIRQNGNEAAHDMESPERARDTLRFTGKLLELVFALSGHDQR